MNDKIENCCDSGVFCDENSKKEDEDTTDEKETPSSNDPELRGFPKRNYLSY